MAMYGQGFSHSRFCPEVISSANISVKEVLNGIACCNIGSKITKNTD
jgi:hypothetical protein